jgi:hypothetical protein
LVNYVKSRSFPGATQAHDAEECQHRDSCQSQGPINHGVLGELRNTDHVEYGIRDIDSDCTASQRRSCQKPVSKRPPRNLNINRPDWHRRAQAKDHAVE